MVKDKRTRFIKTIVFNSVNQIDSIENEVNAVTEKIHNAGGIILSITPHNFGVNPFNLIYNVVYDHDHALTDEELNNAKSE